MADDADNPILRLRRERHDKWVDEFAASLRNRGMAQGSIIYALADDKPLRFLVGFAIEYGYRMAASERDGPSQSEQPDLDAEDVEVNRFNILDLGPAVTARDGLTAIDWGSVAKEDRATKL